MKHLAGAVEAPALGSLLAGKRKLKFLSTKVMPVDAYKIRNSLYLTACLAFVYCAHEMNFVDRWPATSAKSSPSCRERTRARGCAPHGNRSQIQGDAGPDRAFASKICVEVWPLSMLSPDAGSIISLFSQHRGIVRGRNGTGRSELISGRIFDICEPCVAS